MAMINPMDLTGKHVLVTGGSSGIGRETAIKASSLGAKVTIVARNEEAMKEVIAQMDCPELHAYYAYDFMDTDGIADLVSTVVAERGAVDGLIHCAGIADVRPLKLSKPSFMEKVMRINFFSFAELIRSLSIKHNLNDGASIVGISSSAATHGNPSQTAYSSSKSAMNGLIGPVAHELAPRSIRVNTVEFAMVRTRMYDDFVGYSEDGEINIRQYLGVIEVEDAANMLLFLVGNAVRYITGSVIPVYGGTV